jgi:hypothetical protein
MRKRAQYQSFHIVRYSPDSGSLVAMVAPSGVFGNGKSRTASAAGGRNRHITEALLLTTETGEFVITDAVSGEFRLTITMEQNALKPKGGLCRNS